MKVTLLQTYSNEEIAYKAAALCIDKLEAASYRNMNAALKSGHYSIIEHLPMTFLLENISRSLTHQLVRHRLASYSQKSQRYAEVNTNSDWYVTPESIANQRTKITIGYDGEYPVYGNLAEAYENLMEKISWFYNTALKLNVPGEDARYILPNACYTSIIMSMNGRAFIEQCQKRVCGKAQWEIRNMFKAMRVEVKSIYPTIAKYAVPKCVTGKCPESKPCKEPFKE